MKIRLIVRAHALKDSREDERRRFVQDRYDELWRGASDDIRLRDIKAMTCRVSEERFRQIQDKIARKQQLTNDENVIILEWNVQSERAQKADDVEKAKVHHAYMETAATLQDQVISSVHCP